MIEGNLWFVFVSATIVLCITPGPDLLYILTRTLTHGKRVGMASVLGASTGAFVHVVAAAFGLAALLQSSDWAFYLVKFLGAAYLLFLAYQSFRAASLEGFEEEKTERLKSFKGQKVTPWLSFKQAILVDILNPKEVLFFMAFLPQFVREGQGTVSSQMLYLGGIVIAIAIVIESTYVFMAALLIKRIKQNPAFGVWMQRCAGIVFVALSAKLVLS